VVAVVVFEVIAVYSPSMTGNRPDPPERCRTDLAAKCVVTQGMMTNAQIEG
jgi:hypothetical protein